MKELNNTRRLIISTILFVIVLIIGFLTFSTPDFTYKLSGQEMLEQLNIRDNEVTPHEMIQIITNNDQSGIVVDIRDPYVYQKGYLGKAINIPVSDIMQENTIDFFDEMLADSVSVIIYANNQFEANGTWMLLQQLGYHNVKILLGGYNYTKQLKANQHNLAEIPEYHAEKPQIDYADFVKKSTSGTGQLVEQTEASKQILPVRRKKKVVTTGGC
jgi:rhodanese-related sulfurtransferase